MNAGLVLLAILFAQRILKFDWKWLALLVALFNFRN